MTFKVNDRIFETSTTVGTGAYALLGAQTGFQSFSVLGTGNLTAYFATDDINWEVGIGTWTTGPSTLARTTILASSNGGAAVNWGGGITQKIRCGLPSALGIPRVLSKSVAGGVDVALTVDEQSRDVLIFTGVLTGNINVTVDATPWTRLVANLTTGAFRLNFKVAGQTGRMIPQGAAVPAYCDGTDIVFGAAPSDAGVLAAGRNISARTNAATPNTKFDMASDEIILRDANGNTMVAKAVAVTADLGTVGANGIDTGTQAASTWYYGWVIGKPDGTIAALASTSATAPTMPGGYTFKALVTAARSNGSTQFVRFRQLGNAVYFENFQALLTTGTALVETAVSTAALVPPIALAFFGLLEQFVTAGAGAATNQVLLRVVSGSTSLAVGNQSVASSTSYNDVAFELPNIGQNFYYLNSASGASGVSASVSALGFKLPCGGE